MPETHAIFQRISLYCMDFTEEIPWRDGALEALSCFADVVELKQRGAWEAGFQNSHWFGRQELQ